MTRIEQKTLESIIGCTSDIIDRHRCLAALAYAEKRGIKREALKMISDARNSWLNWLTITQRKWQDKTHNPNKARFHFRKC